MTASKPNPVRGANVVDVHVGGKLRVRRKLLGKSQEQLAEDLGVTFQQVQKYERGANRVSASKLYEAASALSTPIGYFFEGLEGSAAEISDQGSGESERAFLNMSEALELSRLFPRLPARKARQIIELVRVLASDEG